MLDEAIAAWIRRRMDGWQQMPQDLLLIAWPTDPQYQTPILQLLERNARDCNLSFLERQASWDYLLDRARDYLTEIRESEEPPFDDIPIPLAIWCMLETSNLPSLAEAALDWKVHCAKGKFGPSWKN